MRIALVLGSGGARGYAHVPVIQEIERRGHEIVAVAGTSMGALVGGVYAAGALEPFTEYVMSMNSADLRRMADLTLRSPGLIRLHKAMDKLSEFTGDVRIENLRIPYTAVATDIDHTREVWFRSGKLIAAIRASISLPAVFTPVQASGRILVDGGLLNPLPIGPTRDVDADLCVAVSLFGRSSGLYSRAPRDTSADDAADTDHDEPDEAGSDGLADSWLGRRLAQLLSRPAEQHLFDDVSSGTDVALIDMAIRALDMMQGQIEIARTAMSAPEVLISVPLDTCSALEFDRAQEVMDLGHRLAVEAFDRAGL
ncbi:MAG: patatin-like phospholipase family protein [Arachnia sp.]